ncbi:MAG TPA: response regulator [Allosphingosinicella sp.]|jgi:DNA-binding response OmpR family regulator
MFHSPVKAARLLIADREDLVLELLRFRLEQLGYLVDSVTTSQKLAQKLGDADYDAIILDDLLPQVEGSDPLQWIKQQESFRDTPVLMLVSRQSEDDIVRLLQLGADDCLPKPLNTRELTARLQRAVIRSRVKPPAVATRALRASVSMPTKLQFADGTVASCRVRDISRSGFMGEARQAIAAGSEVALLLPKLGAVDAEVRWSDGNRFGARFARQLDLSALQ